MNAKERHIEPSPTVAVDRKALSVMIEGHLDMVWYADQSEGCCPKCCGPCSALQQLLDASQLDDLVRPTAEGSDWWDKDKGQVDRAWLAHAWRRAECHERAAN